MSDTRSIFTQYGETTGRVVARETTLLSIVSSVTETDIFNVTIPANVMGRNRALRLSLFYARLNNSGATETAPRLRVYVGGTERFSDLSIALANATTWVAGQIEVLLAMQNATNTMILSGMNRQSIATAPTTGIGDIAGTADIGGAFGSATGTTFTQDTTADWVLRLSWANGTNNALTEFRRHYALLELL